MKTDWLPCEKCGPIEFVIVNGYDIADRLLEGVMFKVFADGRVEYDKNSYTNGLNMKKWSKEAANFSMYGMDVANCPKCEEEFLLNSL